MTISVESVRFGLSLRRRRRYSSGGNDEFRLSLRSRYSRSSSGGGTDDEKSLEMSGFK